MPPKRYTGNNWQNPDAYSTRGYDGSVRVATVKEMQPEHVQQRASDRIKQLTADIKRYQEYIAAAQEELAFWEAVPQNSAEQS